MSITWNGVSSDTIGVVVERIPNRYVPTRRFSPQQVAGRNGNILLVDKSFPNVEQEYEVYLSAEAQGLPSVARACAEWLMGPDGYCRLEDSYDTTVYREAFLMGGYDLENILNKFGRCTITFSCKPQKYLLTGDTPIEIPAGITTYTGDVVQFDGVTGASITSLSTTITPTQDLHGYDHPWPAGGGKNKLLIKDKDGGGITGGYNSAGEYVITGTAGNVAVYCDFTFVTLPAGSYVFSISTLPTGLSAEYQKNGAWAGIVTDGKVITLTEEASISGYIRIGANTEVNTSVKIQLEAGSTKTAWTPYSNICPISGRTGLSVYRTGKNLLNTHLYAGIGYNPPVGTTVTPTDAAQQFTDNGSGVFTLTTSSTWRQYSILIPVVEGGNYHVKFSCSSSGQMGITRGYLDANYKVLQKENSTDTSQSYNYNAVLPMGAAYFFIVITNRSTASATLTLTQPQWEVGSTATAYEPYNGNTYAVDWTDEAGTVYGGTLDVVTGVLTVDIASKVFNGSERWDLWNGVFVNYDCTDIKTEAAETSDTIIIADRFKPNGVKYRAGCGDGNIIKVVGDNPQIACYSSAYADEVAFKASLANSPMTVCYELATPLTYQLSATQVEALVGTNNVWSSSGDVSVTVFSPPNGIVTNPTPFEARPMLEVSGVGEITINGKSIQILESVSDFDIDCEAMEAEDNSKIYCMDFPYLEGGENEIVGDGSITALTVVPRWWTL